MKPTEPDDLRDDERLWRLLGEARPVEVSPFFARRVRRAALEAPAEPAWFAWRRWLLPTAACAGLAALAAGALVPRSDESGADSAVTAEQEFETIADLDLLIASNDSTLWLDSSSSR